jgi:hypothetical protein
MRKALFFGPGDIMLAVTYTKIIPYPFEVVLAQYFDYQDPDQLQGGNVYPCQRCEPAMAFEEVLQR